MVTIEPRTGWSPMSVGELWRYRNLLYFLVWRDVKVRYKQTALGAAWAILQPVFSTIVFSVFFGRLAGMPSDGAPYPVFALAAVVPWTLFSNGLTQAAMSIVANQNLVTKVYFPRMALPVAAVLAGLVDFGLAFLVLVGATAAYGIVPGVALTWIPVLVLLAVVTAIGFGLWFAALNVMYRDVAYIMPFVVQIWLFATPVAYAGRIVPDRWQAVYALNPMVGVVEGFRWSLLGTPAPPPATLAASAIAAIIVLVGGAYYFRAMEDSFADVV